MVDSGGNLPTVFNSLTYGYYDICRQGQSGNCVSLDELITNGKLSSIPSDSNNQTATNTGFKVKYNPIKTELGIFTTSEYTQWAQSNGLTLSDGLVGYWKMDEGSWNGTAGEVKDSSISVNNGTASGGVTTIASKFGSGGSFDGVNDHVSFSSVGTGGDSGSFSAWINFPANYTACTAISNIGALFVGSCAANRLNFDINRASSWVDNNWGNSTGLFVNGVLANTWTYITVTYERGKANIYLDGVLVLTKNYTSGLLTSSGGNWIGKWFNGNNYLGVIDEVRIYNRTLNSIEVKALYELAPAPIAHWKFDETSGSTASDSSGNNYSGILTSGPVWATGKFNNGLQLDGIDDFIPITINVPETNYSYSTWFKTTDSSGSIITVVSPVSPTAGGHDRQFGIYNTGKFCHRVWSDETYCSPLANNDNKWHYAAVTVGSGGGKLYIDGVQVATGAKTSSDFTSEAGLVIGNHSYWGAYSGLVDDLKIYNYVRTPAQILWEYNQGM